LARIKKETKEPIVITKTRAEELGITKFPFIERDQRGMISYSEYESGYWVKYINDYPTSSSMVTSKGKILNMEFHKDGFYTTEDENGVRIKKKHNPTGPDEIVEQTLPKPKVKN